jgi:hypothetical protein
MIYIKFKQLMIYVKFKQLMIYIKFKRLMTYIFTRIISRNGRHKLFCGQLLEILGPSRSHLGLRG